MRHQADRTGPSSLVSMFISEMLCLVNVTTEIQRPFKILIGSVYCYQIGDEFAQIVN